MFHLRALSKSKMTSFVNRSTVMAQSAKRHPPSNSSTFRVATLLMAPQFVWFPDNGPVPRRGYVNEMEKMIELNRQIVLFNNRQFLNQPDLYREMNTGTVGTCDKAPTLNTYGVRTKNLKTPEGTVHVTKHRWSNWREQDPGQMLHLVDSVRNKLAQHAIKYFKEMFVPDYSPPPAWVTTPATTTAPEQPSTTPVSAVTTVATVPTAATTTIAATTATAANTAIAVITTTAATSSTAAVSTASSVTLPSTFPSGDNYMECVDDFPEFIETTTCDPEETTEDILQLNVTTETLLQDESGEEEDITDNLLDEPDQ